MREVGNVRQHYHIQRAQQQRGTLMYGCDLLSLITPLLYMYSHWDSRTSRCACCRRTTHTRIDRLRLSHRLTLVVQPNQRARLAPQSTFAAAATLRNCTALQLSPLSTQPCLASGVASASSSLASLPRRLPLLRFYCSLSASLTHSSLFVSIGLSTIDAITHQRSFSAVLLVNSL